MAKKPNQILRLVGIECLIGAVLAFSLWGIERYQTYLQENKDQLALDIPFEKKSESDHQSLGKTWWFVTIILSPQHYSKNNLEKIFQYYSDKHPNKRQELRVDVFADAETWERFQEDSKFIGTVFYDKQPDKDAPKSKQDWREPHAEFERACENIFYYYCPDLENPFQIEKVILKGQWIYGFNLSECR